MFKNGGFFKRLNLISLWDRFRRRRMEVTRHNFKSLLPDIEEAIRTSSFIAIDGEFTGLNAYRGISPFDLPEQRYDKLQESARQFLLVQFGLCTFHYNPQSDSYSNQVYNFYVWPRPCSRQAPDPRFLCQTSSLDFLISQDFDFNKLFRDGISYLRPAELEKLRLQTLERQEYRKAINTPEQNIGVPPEQEGFLRDVCSKLDTFINSDEVNIEIDRCNAFQRRLVYQTAREKYPTLSLSGLTRSGGERVILVVKGEEGNQRKQAEIQDQTEILELEEALGFSRVIQIISESQKLVVGHNMVLDLCHTLNQFCSPLPETYPEFKEMVATILPNILDTKLMANTIPFREEIYNSSLKELLATVSEKPYIMPTISQRKLGHGYTTGSSKYHEAGYDAFITGLCCISMHRRLSKLTGSKASGVEAGSPHLRPFLNKLYLMKVSDIPYMNLSGVDVVPERNHVFFLDIPKEWKTPDVVHLFSPFGGVSVVWVNDTSVFVALREKAFASTVLQVLQSNHHYTIISYDGYLKRLSSGQISDQNESPPNDSVPAPAKPGSLLRGATQGGAAGAKRTLHTLGNQKHNSGITPTLEKASFKDGAEEEKMKKRPVSPDSAPGLKRSKSIVEDKPFEEPPWE